MKAKLTKTAIAAAQADLLASGGQQAVVFDTVMPSFGVRLGRTGAAAAFLDYRHGRIKKRVTIARIPLEMTIEQARKAAAVLCIEIRSGRDPLAERKAARAPQVGMTVKEAVELWLANGASEWSPVTLGAYRRAMARDITPRSAAGWSRNSIARRSWRS